MELTPYPWLAQSAETLKRMLVKLPNGILLHGPRGCGTYELGLAFAHSILCQQPKDGVACGQCDDCKLLAAGTHPDLRIVLSEAESAIRPAPWMPKKKASDAKKSLSRNIPIESIRALNDFFAITSHRGGRRVVLIYPANMMAADQSSALLKNLEEPPENVVIILASDDIESMLPTIRSRCQLVRVTPPQRQEALEFLRKEGVKEAESELARAGGMPLLVFEDDKKLRLDKDREKQILQLLCKGALISSADVIANTTFDVPLFGFVTLLQRWVYDLAVISQGGEARYFVGYSRQLSQLAQNVQPQAVHELARALYQDRRVANHPLNSKLIAQELLIRYAKACQNKAK